MIEHIQFNTSSLKDQTDQVPETNFRTMYLDYHYLLHTWKL